MMCDERVMIEKRFGDGERVRESVWRERLEDVVL